MKLRLLASIVPLVLLASACRTDQVMWATCAPENDPWGTDGTYVLVCQDGEWKPVMTVAEYVAIKQGKKITIAPLPTKPTTTTTTTTTAAPATTSTTTTSTTSTTSTTTTTVTTVTPSISFVNPNEGPTAGGQTTVITGTGFTGTTAVTIDGAAVSFVVDSDTQITATTPAHAAGAVAVAVTNPSGTDTFNGGYTYVSMPTVSGLSVSTGPAAGGTTVIITGTNLSGVGSVDFGPTAAASFTVNSSTQITAVSPAGAAGAVNVRVTSWGGISDAASANEFTYT